MATRSKGLLTGIIGVFGAAGLLALTVYPFDYGLVESAVLAGAFVLVTDPPRCHDAASYVPVHPLFRLERPNCRHVAAPSSIPNSSIR